MFFRKIESKLYEYYNDVNAKIIVINGARQIGKVLLLKKLQKKGSVKSH
ncbi:MAG: hypothetical protein ACI4U5_06700 [Bacilli bacterium]